MVRREPPAWRTVDTPTESTLHDVCSFASGAVAVGEDGVVLGRPLGESWQKVLQDGPATNSNDLRAIDATDEGARVWYAGESGALGTYDVASAVKRDFSGPNGHTNDWIDVAVAGRANEERAFLVSDSGEVLPITVSQRTLSVGEPSRPPSMESNVAAVATGVEGRLVLLSESGHLYTTEEGKQWTSFDLDADGFVGLSVTQHATYLATHDATGFVWKDDEPVAFPFGRPTLHAVDATPDRFVAVGTEGGVYRRATDGWVAVHTGTKATLRGITLGDPDVAVGAGGIVLERATEEHRAEDEAEQPDVEEELDADVEESADDTGADAWLRAGKESAARELEADGESSAR